MIVQCVFFSPTNPLTHQEADKKHQLVSAEVTWEADWLLHIDVSVTDTPIGSKLCLETKAGFCGFVLLQGAAMID